MGARPPPADEQHEAAGLNDSATHTDFMVGGPEVEIDGVEPGGAAVAMLRGGDLAAVGVASACVLRRRADRASRGSEQPAVAARAAPFGAPALVTVTRVGFVGIYPTNPTVVASGALAEPPAAAPPLTPFPR